MNNLVYEVEYVENGYRVRTDFKLTFSAAITYAEQMHKSGCLIINIHCRGL